MIKRWLVLAGWLVFVAGSIAALHRLGNAFPLELALQPGGTLEPALAAVLRMAGLAVGYWLAITTLLYLFGRTGRLPGAIRAVGWTTIGPIKRLVDGVVAGAVVVGFGLPATALAMTGPGYIPVPAGDPVGSEVAVPGSLPEALSSPSDHPPVPMAGDAATPPPAPVANTPVQIEVRAGDHMWALAEKRLTTVLGREVADVEVAPYWLKVVGANLSRIRSGDPDLIFPGEILLLPEIDP
ncbi:MAG TPA: hypothetical protein VJQ79_06345 [Acidimicrobiia bacterium]|nr:hypothetical protein [Acidimicrobiia bacterium]